MTTLNLGRWRFSKGGNLDRLHRRHFYNLCSSRSTLHYLFIKIQPSLPRQRFLFKRRLRDETPCANVGGIPPFEKREGGGSRFLLRPKGEPASPLDACADLRQTRGPSTPQSDP